ncbi:uncharacterized protein LOC115402638 isoform X2 [Salarias fasciatus]|uniref:uncharacterized protein LOC115402638 isoform X2 n=1 Tax=Salarias fasciatus TaxID=181472 RepID=UPI001176D8D8|nr:uncharacterized protein LOC115402638 isoform X2 [Salarias fasciatus]
MNDPQDDPMDGNNSDGHADDPSQTNGGSLDTSAGKEQTDQPSQSQPSPPESGPTAPEDSSNKPCSGGGSTQPPQQKKLDAAEIKRVLQELKPVLQPRYLEHVERWMKQDGVEPKELLEVLKSTQKETKLSLSSCLSSLSWTLSSFSTVTLSSVVTGQTFGAHQVIINQLKIKQLRVTELTPKNQHQCQSIILFCPITSRAGSDVEAAMRTPAVAATDKRIFLVLLYHTRDVDYSTAGKSCAEKFPRVLSEFHVLFHETQNGLLKCEQNSQAIRELREAICAQFGLS